jgi:hypothetical protein
VGDVKNAVQETRYFPSGFRHILLLSLESKEQSAPPSSKNAPFSNPVTMMDADAPLATFGGVPFGTELLGLPRSMATHVSDWPDAHKPSSSLSTHLPAKQIDKMASHAVGP